MAIPTKPDWDPTAAEVTRDQRAAYDEMREIQPVAYSELLGWSLFRHADVLHVLRDHATFSNEVSRHLSVPNGMDPPKHTAYRRLIEQYFTLDRMQAFRPTCQAIAGQIVDGAFAHQEIEVMRELGQPFAARIQCAFLGWPVELSDDLIRWMLDSQNATYAQDRAELSRLANDFELLIDSQLDVRRVSMASEPADVTGRLMSERIDTRTLNHSEIASILRNWTGGEIGTIASAIGILVDYLATHLELQDQLRRQPELLSPAIDEILRMDGPLAVNRRVTTKSVRIGERQIPAQSRLTLMWIPANRDPRVFPEPDQFRWDRDPKSNLLYGEGIHVCPGAPLARLELVTFMEELLRRTTNLRSVEKRTPRRAVYPAAGYSEVYVEVEVPRSDPRIVKSTQYAYDDPRQA